MSNRPHREPLGANARQDDVDRRDQVLARILDCVRADTAIKLPPYDGSGSPGDFALQDLGDNEFSGTIHGYRYQFEGEEDLLHLIVSRQDRQPLTVEEGREVAAFVVPNVSPAVIWLRPGTYSQHFFLGHDELLSKS